MCYAPGLHVKPRTDHPCASSARTGNSEHASASPMLPYHVGLWEQKQVDVVACFVVSSIYEEELALVQNIHVGHQWTVQLKTQPPPPPTCTHTQRTHNPKIGEFVHHARRPGAPDHCPRSMQVGWARALQPRIHGLKPQAGLTSRPSTDDSGFVWVSTCSTPGADRGKQAAHHRNKASLVVHRDWQRTVCTHAHTSVKWDV